MAEEPIQKDDVARALDECIAAGEWPTREALREKMGRGSPARIGKLFDEVRTEMLQDLQRVPGPLLRALGTIHRDAVTAAEQQVNQILERERTALRISQSDLDQAREAMLSERASAQQHLDALSRELDERRRRQAQLDDQLAEHQTTIANLQRKLAVAESQAAEAQGERERAAAAHQADRQLLQDRAQARETYFLRQIDELKTQSQQLRTARDKESALHERRRSELENQLQTERQRAQRLQIDLTDQRTEAEALRAAVARETSTRYADAQQSALMMDELRRQLTSVTQERDDARLRESVLIVERDGARLDAASQRGQADALAAQLSRIPVPDPRKKNRKQTAANG